MTSEVGALTLPVPEDYESVAPAVTPFADPFILGLLDFFGHVIKDAIETRLVQLRPTLITDACPEANRHGFDPRQSFVRLPTPSLFLWWGSGRSKNIEHSTLRNRRERELSLLYVVAPVKYPDGAEVFAGVTNAVDAALARASDRGWHPTYGFADDPVGTPLVRSLAPPGVLGWSYEGGTSGVLEPVPRKRRNADPNMIEDCFPALQGTVKVVERIECDSPDEIEELEEGTLTVTSDGVTYFTRVLSPA